jgi:hypothetical protein
MPMKCGRLGLNSVASHWPTVFGRDGARLIPRVQNIFIFDTDNRDRSPATTVNISHNYGSLHSVTGGTPAPKGKIPVSKKEVQGLS